MPVSDLIKTQTQNGHFISKTGLFVMDKIKIANIAKFVIIMVE